MFVPMTGASASSKQPQQPPGLVLNVLTFDDSFFAQNFIAKHAQPAAPPLEAIFLSNFAIAVWTLATRCSGCPLRLDGARRHCGENRIQPTEFQSRVSECGPALPGSTSETLRLNS
jgi:hypothetical protein